MATAAPDGGEWGGGGARGRQRRGSGRAEEQRHAEEPESRDGKEQGANGLVEVGGVVGDRREAAPDATVKKAGDVHGAATARVQKGWVHTSVGSAVSMDVEAQVQLVEQARINRQSRFGPALDAAAYPFLVCRLRTTCQ